MNARQRNKYGDYIDCSHKVYEKQVLSDDPYIKHNEVHCNLGRYNMEDFGDSRCYYCRHFTLSRISMKKARETKKKFKAESKPCFYSPYEEEKEEEESARYINSLLGV